MTNRTTNILYVGASTRSFVTLEEAQKWLGSYEATSNKPDADDRLWPHHPHRFAKA